MNTSAGTLPTGATLRDRNAVRTLGWFALAVLVAVVALTFAARSGGTLADPVGHRVYEIGIAAAAVGLLIVGIAQSVRAGKLSRLLLTAVASGTAFWQETYGDWGAYLLYSDRFVTYDWGRHGGRRRCNAGGSFPAT